MVNRTCPSLTSSPSLNRTLVTTPETCDVTATARIGSTVPGAVTSKGTSRISVFATVTGTDGGAGRPRLSEHAPSSRRRRPGNNEEVRDVIAFRVSLEG